MYKYNMGKRRQLEMGLQFQLPKIGYFYYSHFLFSRQLRSIIFYKLALCQTVEFAIECAKLFMFISMKKIIYRGFSTGAFKSPCDQLFLYK